MKELEDLKRKLKIAEANVDNEMIQKDPILKKSAEKKIAELKSEIANYFVKGKKEEPKKEEKVVKAPEPKKEVVKKEKVEKPKKESVGIVNANVKVGDKVRAIKKNQTGVVVNLKPSADYADKILVSIKDDKIGKVFKAYAHLVEKLK